MSSVKQVPTTKVKQGSMFSLQATHPWFSPVHPQLVDTQDIWNIPCLATRRQFLQTSLSGSLLINYYAPKQLLKFLSRKLDLLLHNQVLLKPNLKIKLEEHKSVLSISVSVVCWLKNPQTQTAPPTAHSTQSLDVAAGRVRDIFSRLWWATRTAFFSDSVGG